MYYYVYVHMCAGANGGQNRILGFMKLELQTLSKAAKKPASAFARVANARHH